MKNLLSFILLLTAISYVSGNEITKDMCEKQKGNFIFAGGECIEYTVVEGEKKDAITIIVHGTWKAGTDILARYTPFAETINMSTDITTVAVALPGYSHSSANHLHALSHKSRVKPFATKDYIIFLDNLVQALKKRFDADKVNYIGHSAGASMGATLTGYHPGLINNIALAGGRYRARKAERGNGMIFINDYINKLDKKTHYLLVFGTKDTISKPRENKNFYELAKEKGLNITLVKVENAKHLDLDMTDASIEAIEKMLK